MECTDMTYTTLSASGQADNTDTTVRALVLFALLAKTEKTAVMALMDRAVRDPSYLPTMDDLNFEMSRQQVA
jgi:hypothetical protein